MATNRIPNNDGGIQPTLVTAKGDLIGAVAAGTPTNVAVGTNGQSLTADSTAATGVSWQSLIPSQTSNSGKYLTTNGTATSWGAVATGSLTLLSTTTLSGASTTVSSIPSGYTNLLVTISNYYGAAGANPFKVQPNGNSYPERNVSGAGSTSATNQTDILSNTTNGLSASQANASSVLIIYNYTDTTIGKPYQIFGNDNPGRSDCSYLGAGSINTLLAITSLVFSPNLTTWSGGTVKVYGVN